MRWLTLDWDLNSMYSNYKMLYHSNSAFVIMQGMECFEDGTIFNVRMWGVNDIFISGIFEDYYWIADFTAPVVNRLCNYTSLWPTIIITA